MAQVSISGGFTYSSDNIQTNSLTANLIKYPEISKVLIQQFPQYSLTYFTEGLGRYAKDVKIGDRQYEWKVLGRTQHTATLGAAITANSGAHSGNAGPTTFSVTISSAADVNDQDILRTPDGTMLLVESKSGATLTVRAMSGDASYAGVPAVANGSQLAVVGSAFEEGSTGAGQSHYFPSTFRNYTTIMRKSKTITGSALTDISWIENNGSRLWFFTDEQVCLRKFMYEQEVLRWYGTRTVNVDSGTAYANAFAGDGLLAQIDSGNQSTYTTTLTEAAIINFLASLKHSSGVMDNEWVVHTGIEGLRQFDQAMKTFYVTGAGSLHYDADKGMSIELGGNFRTYHALGDKITLVHNPIFDDPKIHTAASGFSAPLSGLPKESGKFVFLNMGKVDGASNIEIVSKAAEGVDRGFITKYVPGMVNPFDQKSMIASSSTDGFTVEYLSESGIVVRDPLSCGILSMAKYLKCN